MGFWANLAEGLHGMHSHETHPGRHACIYQRSSVESCLVEGCKAQVGLPMFAKLLLDFQVLPYGC